MNCILWYCIVLHVFCIVLYGIAWYHIISDGIAWYCIDVGFGAWAISRKTAIYFQYKNIELHYFQELQELEALMAGGMTVEEALAFLTAKNEKEEEETMRKEMEEAERIIEEAKLKGYPVLEMEDGGKLIKEKLRETFQTKDGGIEIDNELITDLEDRYSKLKSSSLNEVELEKEAISIVAALLNYTDLNYHIMLSMVTSVKVNLKFFLNFPTVQDLIAYIVN